MSEQIIRTSVEVEGLEALLAAGMPIRYALSGATTEKPLLALHCGGKTRMYEGTWTDLPQTDAFFDAAKCDLKGTSQKRLLFKEISVQTMEQN